MPYTETFKDAMARAGIPCSDPINADGNLHRYRTQGDTKDTYWYVLYPDVVAAGAFGCQQRGITQTWCGKDRKALTRPELLSWRKRMKDAKAQRDQDVARARAVTAISRLAALSQIDYELIRQKEADQLGVRVSTLDDEVKRARNGTSDDSAQGTAVLFEDIAPWPEVVNGAKLLDDLAASASRHIVLPVHGETILALWVLFTYFIDVVDTAPMLALYSPEKRCGKTTVLHWLSRLVHKPLSTSHVTSSAVFRVIEAWQPTLLIDEADTFIKHSDELRNVLNSGHTRANAWAVRNVGEAHEPRRFSTWGAKAIALIGRLRDTLDDRSIVIHMRRKFATDNVKKLRHADGQLFKSLRRHCQRFANDNSATVSAARPTIPETLHDRAGDNWEPLLAIADIAGGPWPERAREAAQAVSAGLQTENSDGVLLLADIREVFTKKRTDRIATKELLEALTDMEERPWREYKHGRPLNDSQLARLLRQFSIFSRSIRIRDRTPKGYFLDQFEDAFTRYLPASNPPQRHNTIELGNSGDSAVATSSSCGGPEDSDRAHESSGCGGVADETPLAGEEIAVPTVANLEKGGSSDQLLSASREDAEGV